MFQMLENINRRPAPWEFYTARDLWTAAYTSERMLAFHLDETVGAASRSGAFIERSVAWIAAYFGVGTGTAIADFGCGPGLYAARLARRGAQVTGIDFSARSIEYARDVAQAEGLPIRYVQQDYLTFATDERFDLAMMIMCDFCALSPTQREKLLRTFHTVLRSSGAVLLDVYSPAAFTRRAETATYGAGLLDGFWASAPYYGFLNVFKYPAEQVVLDKYTIVEADRTRTVYNWLQYFSPETLRGELAAGGFEVVTLLADVAGAPFDAAGDEFAVVARKA